MMRIPLLRTLLICLLACAAIPAAASANATDDRILRDCQLSATGALTGSYTQAELRHAKNNIPGDQLSYSGCFDAIRQAMLSGESDGRGGGGPLGGGPGGGDSGGFGGTGDVGGTAADGGAGGAADGAAAPGAPGAPQHTGTEAPVAIAGTSVEPGELPSLGSDARELPGAVLVLLVLLGLAAIAAAALTIGRRVIARRRA